MRLHRLLFGIAIGGALALPIAGCTTTITADGTGGTTNVTPTPTAITTHAELRDTMRQLWTEHVFWTRLFLIDTTAGLPDGELTSERLLQNQDDIGNAIRPFYGDAAGDQLTALLREHITGAVAVVSAALADDPAQFDQANAAWYENADEIAAFLASANPNWSQAALEQMMYEHLDRTLDEATARLDEDYASDIQIYDGIENQILGMADVFTEGITAQFPDLVSFDDEPLASDEALHVDMRRLWEQHVEWTRIFIIDAVEGLPETDLTTNRLLQNQTDIGDAIKPFYGEDAGTQLSGLLTTHILQAADLVDAAIVGDQARFEAVDEEWYQNGDDIANFLAGNLPFLDPLTIQRDMDTHLQQTEDEVSARLAGDYSTEISTYDGIEEHILMMSDDLSEAITAQFSTGVPQ